MSFHYRHEYCIFFGKKATQSVYFAARYDCRVPLSEYAEHTVRSHAMRMVFVPFCITPSCRSLALQGKPGDVAMGGVYVLVHPSQPCHAAFHLPHLPPLIYQNGDHTAYDRR